MLFKPSLKTREVVLDTESFAVSVILTSSSKCVFFFFVCSCSDMFLFLIPLMF